MENSAKTLQRQESEAAIRRTIERMQAGYQNKSGELFASAFAETHDYVVINGMLVPGMTREANAQVHQELFEGSRQGALGADLSKMESPHIEIRNIRFLTDEVAIAHIVGTMGGQDATIASAVLHHHGTEWLIIAYHNAPVLNGRNPQQSPG